MKLIATFSHRILLVASLALATQSVKAEQELSPSAQAVQVNMPDYVAIMGIAETETRVRISGKPSDFQQNSILMRLFDEVGSMPDLKSISSQDAGAGSVFVFVKSLSR